MGRRNKRDDQTRPQTDWESERTLAAAEEDAAQGESGEGSGSDTACTCGNRELLLEAYLRVEDGKPDPTPIEVGTLTCPECGREYDAIEMGDGRIIRGDFQGTTELDD